MNEKTYLLSETTKRNLDTLIRDNIIDVTSPVSGRRPSVASGKGGSSFTLFQVVRLSDTSIKINGYNTSEGRYSHNYIILGLSRIVLADATACTGITYTGVLYLSITYSSSGYAATLQFAASLPAQDNTHIYHYLADIVCVDGVISQIIQPPTSIIHFPGRIL